MQYVYVCLYPVDVVGVGGLGSGGGGWGVIPHILWGEGGAVNTRHGTMYIYVYIYIYNCIFNYTLYNNYGTVLLHLHYIVLFGRICKLSQVVM